MLDLIYWAGQIALLLLELVGIFVIILLPALWIVGAIIEMIYKFKERRK